MNVKEVVVEIETGLVRGTMSSRALKMVFEWSEMHREDVVMNWERARERKPLRPISPLA